MNEAGESTGRVIKKLAKIMDEEVRHQNLETLRQEEQRLGTPESRRTKELFENSTICLLGNLLGLTAINLARGMNPKQHELTHRWSRPLHLFLLLTTSVNLCAVGWLGYRYVQYAPEGVQELFSLAQNPRIYLGLDKVEREKDGLKVVHLTSSENAEGGAGK